MKHGYQRVLIVDSNPDFLYGFAAALRHEGLTVLSVSGSEPALEAMDTGFRPDAVVVDFSPRDIYAAELLRRAHALRTIPVIATSAATALRRIGPLAHRELPKPIHLDELLVVLDQLCNSPRSPAGRDA